MPKQPPPPPNTELPPSQTARVTLPPLMGLSPLSYIPVLYGAVATLLILGIVLVPGLVAPGARLRIVSFPPNAAIFFGEKAYGATPAEVFVPAGKTQMSLRRPGFPDAQREVDVPNNLMFGLFFPARMELEVSFAPGDTTFIKARFQRNLSDFSLAAPYEENRQPFPLFTEVKADLLASGLLSEEVDAYLKRFLPFIADYYLYKNLRLALSETAPGTLEEEKKFWRGKIDFDTLPFVDVWLFSNRPMGEKTLLRREGFFASITEKLSLGGRRPSLGPSPFADFFSLPEGSWLFGPDTDAAPAFYPWEYPYLSRLNRVMVQGRLVTQGEFARFLDANPVWDPKNKADLMERGWVDENYLKDWVDGSPPQSSQPVVHVSYAAALAFVAAYDAPRGWKARLPYDPEWEALARGGRSGSLLEWMYNAYAPAEFLLHPAGKAWSKAPAGMAPSVRGLTEYNEGRDAEARRGALPPETCSAFLGFRLVYEAQ